jgi:predicted nucleic acid-binding protein
MPFALGDAPLAALLHARPKAAELITPWIIRREVTTSILAYAEVVEYIRGLPYFGHHHGALRTLLRGIYPYFLTYSILDRYAEIRRLLRPPFGRGLIGDIDTLVAATALERHLTVVTADADSQRVPGLDVIILSREELRRR